MKIENKIHFLGILLLLPFILLVSNLDELSAEETDPNLLRIAPLYEQLLPIMEIARYFPPPEDWDWAPVLEAKLEEILPTN